MTGRTVVFFSNPQADPAWWTPPFAAALADAGYKSVAFVHSGDSFAPPDVVRDAAAFVEGLRAGPVHVLGWSQGAAIAQEVALSRPDLVAGAALIATYGRQNSIDRLIQEAWAVLDAAPRELDPVRELLVLLMAYPPELLGEDRSAEPLLAGVKTRIAALSPDDEAHRRSIAFVTAYQERLADLGAISVPCLVVGFELDMDTFAARAREVADAIPRSRYVELPGAGHLAPALDPPSIIAPVLAFFQEVDREVDREAPERG